MLICEQHEFNNSAFNRNLTWQWLTVSTYTQQQQGYQWVILLSAAVAVYQALAKLPDTHSQTQE